MKKIALVLVTIFSLSVSGIAQTAAPEIVDYCTSSETKKKVKGMLGDYSYDASKSTKITFKEKPQLKELEIPLFMGEKYKFVFSKEGTPENVDIEIWDHKFESKKRELLFSSKDFPADQKVFEWEPEKSKKMYINYKIPPTSDVTKKGCVIFVLGYHTKGGKE
jgi:hypothetical protein